MLYYLVYLPISLVFLLLPVLFFAVVYLFTLQLTSIPGLNDVTVAKSTQSQIQSNAVAAPQNELTQDGMTSPPSNINSNANVNGVAQPVSDPSTVSCAATLYVMKLCMVKMMLLSILNWLKQFCGKALTHFLTKIY